MALAALTTTEAQKIRTVMAPAASVSDQDLVNRTVEGDNNAYGGIMRRYNQRMFRLARSIVRDDSAAMDVVQESHIKAFSRLDSFTGESSLIAWLHAITRNEALMYLRKHKMESAMITTDEHLPGAADVDTTLHLVAAVDIPDKAAENEQLKILINSKLDELPEDFRTVFVLRAIEQLSVRETAQILEIKSETVKTRYFRAKRMIRKKIQNYLDVSGVSVYEFGGEHCDMIVHNVLLRIASKTGK